MGSSYVEGTRVILRAEYRTPGGTLADPDDVLCAVRRPDGTVEELETDRLSTGIYQAAVLTDNAGTWGFGFRAEGEVEVASEGRFYVSPWVFVETGS